MKTLRDIVENRNTKGGLIFDITIQIIILISITTFSLETLPEITEEHHRLFYSIESVCIYLFCVEYALRLIVAKNKLKFIFSFYGIVDLIAIVPFFLLQLDLSTIRALHFLRLFRILKFARYTKVFHRFNLALKYAKEELILFISTTVVLLYLSGVGIYFFEHEAQPDKFTSIFESFWWAIATLTTVGYGDIVPITLGGKIFTFCILMIGLGIVAVPAGVISSSLSKARDDIEKEKQQQDENEQITDD